MSGLSARSARSRVLAAAGASLCLCVISCSSAADPAGGAATAPGGASAAMLAAGRVGPGSAAPWRRVGAGWALAEYTRLAAVFGPPKKAEPAALYLVDPAGGKYLLHRWRATKKPWELVDWSGDKTRALFIQPGTGTRLRLHQLVLRSGKVTTFSLPAGADPIGYTKPDGTNLLASFDGVVRYNLRGAFQVRLSRGTMEASAISAPDGRTEVVAGRTGLEVVSNSSGRLVRRLRVRGADAKLGCSPVRWWSARTVLASCPAKSTFEARLWLVPARGGAARALTPVRKPGSHDFGDVDAWRLPSGLYLQALGACGAEFIAKQAANGSVHAIRVPGGTGNNNRVAAVAGRRMLVQVQTGCPGSTSLLWFNPATRAVVKVLTAPRGAIGVMDAVAYNRRGDQP